MKKTFFFFIYWSIYSFFKKISLQRILSKWVVKLVPERKKEKFLAINSNNSYYTYTYDILITISLWTMLITLSLFVMLIFDVFLLEFVFKGNIIIQIVAAIIYLYICYHINQTIDYDDEKYEKLYERVPTDIKKKWGWITFFSVILVLCYNALCVWLITKLQH